MATKTPFGRDRLREFLHWANELQGAIDLHCQLVWLRLIKGTRTRQVLWKRARRLRGDLRLEDTNENIKDAVRQLRPYLKATNQPCPEPVPDNVLNVWHPMLARSQAELEHVADSARQKARNPRQYKTDVLDPARAYANQSRKWIAQICKRLRQELNPPGDLERAIERMREVIRQHGQKTPDTLIKAAQINRQLGRKALRKLATCGEYTGFKR